MRNNNFESKAANFFMALTNVYKDEEEQTPINKLVLDEENLTEDFTAILSAMLAIYQQICDESEDIIGFTHLLNRSAIQHIMEAKEVSND